MLGDENNLRDKRSQVGLSIKDTTQPSISYTKTNKLVTALFMVTDIMDKTEPLRNTLRTLGSQIISDIHSDPSKATAKIGEILSFLDIASSVNMVSDMNASILKNEFLKLLESVKEYRKIKSIWLEEFLETADTDNQNDDQQKYSELITRRHIPSSRTSTRLGVQKANTLMSAINNIKDIRKSPAPYEAEGFRLGFDVLKKHRRADIITVLNTAGIGLTITEIKDKSKGQKDVLSALASCGEKTLQRELVAMVRDGVLKKEGEKRWSRYSIK